MTIDEAIEAIDLIIKYPKTLIGFYTLKALQLSIEALKEVVNLRARFPVIHFDLLSGETEE